MKIGHWIVFCLVVVAAILWVIASVEVAFGVMGLALFVELVAVAMYGEPSEESEK